jgi:hypothetical protein
MQFSSIYNFEKPEGTDPADGAGQISTLADQVDTALAALASIVSGKSASTHNHNATYSVLSHNHDAAYGKGVQMGGAVAGTTSEGATAYTPYTSGVTLTAGRYYLIHWGGIFTSEATSGEDPDLYVNADVYLQRRLGSGGTTNLQTLAMGTTGTYTASRRPWHGSDLTTVSTTGTYSFRYAVDRLSTYGACQIFDCYIQVLDVGPV